LRASLKFVTTASSVPPAAVWALRRTRILNSLGGLACSVNATNIHPAKSIERCVPQYITATCSNVKAARRDVQLEVKLRLPGVRRWRWCSKKVVTQTHPKY